ncbi:thioredoxin [Halosimplex pelagicum]|uniref:Thioredoxin n=1 Tax=Halosimplex pelagicum TaxID=869886 RepID=A0A7D5TI42_9EURY|nr:thioredoxin [Halosimplex pelagicum]QLH83456.1 thioredoxin [Halosimplex pelagicum]
MTTETAGDSGAGTDAPVAVNGESELDELVASGDVVLADFHADWCGPCKALEPVVERIAETTAATVAKVDVDANQQLASSYGVRGVPTLVLFAGGEQVEQVVGAQPEPQLRALVEEYSG